MPSLKNVVGSESLPDFRPFSKNCLPGNPQTAAVPPKARPCTDCWWPGPL